MLGALDRGCLYNWYSTRVILKTQTLASHMFPFTPVELHSGVVIGKERILTNRSGRFGWGDNSTFDAYVYDHAGRPTRKVRVKSIVQDGKRYAEVRLPEGYSAAIVRHIDNIKP